jgi:DNA polymerase elongation subunit (family B)
MLIILIFIDIEWYMETQILPPILRLVEPIEGTNSALIAHCLGIMIIILDEWILSFYYWKKDDKHFCY